MRRNMREIPADLLPLILQVVGEQILQLVALLRRKTARHVLEEEIENRKCILRAILEQAETREQNARIDILRRKAQHGTDHTCGPRIISNHEIAERTAIKILRCLLTALDNLREHIDDIGIIPLLKAGIELPT